MQAERRLPETDRSSATIRSNAASRCVALLAAGVRRMQEDERFADKMLDGNTDDVAGASEACERLPDLSFGLKSSCPQPLVGECETLAAVIILAIVDAHRTA